MFKLCWSINLELLCHISTTVSVIRTVLINKFRTILSVSHLQCQWSELYVQTVLISKFRIILSVSQTRCQWSELCVQTVLINKFRPILSDLNSSVSDLNKFRTIMSPVSVIRTVSISPLVFKLCWSINLELTIMSVSQQQYQWSELCWSINLELFCQYLTSSVSDQNCMFKLCSISPPMLISKFRIILSVSQTRCQWSELCVQTVLNSEFRTIILVSQPRCQWSEQYVQTVLINKFRTMLLVSQLQCQWSELCVQLCWSINLELFCQYLTSSVSDQNCVFNCADQ